MKEEAVLGGVTYDVAPRVATLRVSPPELLDLLRAQQGLVGRYEELVAAALAGDTPSADQTALIERLGRAVENQHRLLEAVLVGTDASPRK
jgi:hypothetical protein